jgi:hypothetical protein
MEFTTEMVVKIMFYGQKHEKMVSIHGIVEISDIFGIIWTNSMDVGMKSHGTIIIGR